MNYIIEDNKGEFTSELYVKRISGNGTVSGDVKTYVTRTGVRIENSSGDVGTYDIKNKTFYWSTELFNEDGDVVLELNFKGKAPASERSTTRRVRR